MMKMFKLGAGRKKKKKTCLQYGHQYRIKGNFCTAGLDIYVVYIFFLKQYVYVNSESQTTHKVRYVLVSEKWCVCVNSQSAM